MRTCQLGPFNVSAIGLGCMNLSAGYGTADEEASEQLLLSALDTGYLLLDTAAIYGGGHNETLIGRVLQRRRQQFVLASKGGMSRDADGNPKACGRPELLKLECEASLRRLQTEVIDLYYLHRLDPDVPIEESIGAMGELVREGKVQTLGLSEVCVETLKRAHREHPITAVQSEYSLWSRTPERGMLAACAELGISFVPFSPLGRGFLAGSAQDVDRLSDGDLRLGIARPRFEPANFAANSKLLPPLAEIAARNGCTLAQLALAWLLNQGNSEGRCRIVPIPGTRSVEHMIENAAAAKLELSKQDLAELDGLVNEDTVVGARYTDALMAGIDSELD